MPSFCNIMLEMSHNYIANGVNHFGHYLRNINNNKVPNKASLNNDLENSIQFNSVHPHFYEFQGDFSGNRVIRVNPWVELVQSTTKVILHISTKFQCHFS